MKMIQFSEQFQMAYEKAKSFLENITLSSRLGVAPDRATLSFLRATVKSQSYTVYRGLDLDELPEGLVIGGEVPANLAYPKDAQVCIHTTKDLNIAKEYATGHRSYGIVYSLTCNSSEVIFDSTNVMKAFPDLLQPDLIEYFDKSKEVLLKKDASFLPRVVSVLG